MSTTNERSTSTTWAWRRVKISRPPEATGHSRSKSVRWRRFRPTPITTKLHIEVTYKGGAEAWCLVRARGENNVVPGHMAIYDLLMEITGAGRA